MHIPSRNPTRAAAQQCRIAAELFCLVRQEKRQAQIRRAVPVSRPAAQESRITAAAHRARWYRANPHSSAALLHSRLMHNAERPEWRLPQTQCQTILRLHLPHPEAQHTPSALQEYQVIRPAAKHEMCKRNLFSSAVPLCRLRARQAHSQRQNIRLHRYPRDPVWQEIRLCRTAAHRQLPHKTVRQENSLILILYRPAIPQELARDRSKRIVRRIRQRPVRQEHSARLSAGVIPNLCSRRRTFPRMGAPRSRSKIMFLPSSPAARRSRQAEHVWMATLQIGSIPHPQRRYLRQRCLLTAKLVHLRVRPRGLMQRVRQNSALRSAQCPRKTAAQKNRRRKLLRTRPPLPLHRPTGRAGNRQLWAA